MCFLLLIVQRKTWKLREVGWLPEITQCMADFSAGLSPQFHWKRIHVRTEILHTGLEAKDLSLGS